MDYRQVTNLIRERELRSVTGATPENTVNSYLHRLTQNERVEAVVKGMFAVPEKAEAFRQRVVAAEAAALAEVSDPNHFTVKAYGLYWDRDLVNWRPTPNSSQAQLLGSQGLGRSEFRRPRRHILAA